MAFRDEVSKLARRLRISNDPELREEDLTIATLEFYNEDGRQLTVPATRLNKAGRLFFEQFFREGLILIQQHELFRATAKEYFAERWGDEPDPERALIFGLRTFEYVRIEGK